MPLTLSVALTLAALSGAAHSLTIGSRALMAAAPPPPPSQAAIAKELEERDRFKTEVEKKVLCSPLLFFASLL